MKQKSVIKLSKIILIASVALFFTLVVLNNLTDYGSNYLFVQHVLSMDTTFEGNSLMWRAITSPAVHSIFYWIIILWEILIAIFCWIGTIALLRNKKSDKKFQNAKTYGIIGLVLSLLLWFLAFITIGGEWFAMWQSPIWNGQDAAFRMFTITGIIFLFLMMKDD